MSKTPEETCNGSGDKPGSEMTILSNPQLFALLMSTIDERVATRTRERNESLRNWLIGILTVGTLTILTIGNFALEYFANKAVDVAVEDNVNAVVQAKLPPAVKAELDRSLSAAVSEEVKRATEKIVEPAVNKAVDEVQFDASLAALNFRALSLDLAEGFAANEANSIIQQIKSLHSRMPDPESGEKLLFAVETALESFASANRVDLVNRLEEAAPDVFQMSGAAVPVMVQTQGFNLLSAPGAPSVWMEENGILRQAYSSYQQYANSARIGNYPELYFAYEMLIRHLERRPEKEVEELISAVDDLSGEDSESFIQILNRLATGTITRRQDVATKTVSTRTHAFLCKYDGKGELISAVVKIANLDC